LGSADIRVPTTNSTSGTARIQKPVTQTVTGQADIRGIANPTVSGTARIRVSVVQEVGGTADLQAHSTRTVTGTSTIYGTTTHSIGGFCLIVPPESVHASTQEARVSRPIRFVEMAEPAKPPVMAKPVEKKPSLRFVEISQPAKSPIRFS
jgi:hypothetical protein